MVKRLMFVAVLSSLAATSLAAERILTEASFTHSEFCRTYRCRATGSWGGETLDLDSPYRLRSPRAGEVVNVVGPEYDITTNGEHLTLQYLDAVMYRYWTEHSPGSSRTESQAVAKVFYGFAAQSNRQGAFRGGDYAFMARLLDSVAGVKSGIDVYKDCLSRTGAPVPGTRLRSFSTHRDFKMGADTVRFSCTKDDALQPGAGIIPRVRLGITVIPSGDPWRGPRVLAISTKDAPAAAGARLDSWVNPKSDTSFPEQMMRLVGEYPAACDPAFSTTYGTATCTIFKGSKLELTNLLNARLKANDATRLQPWVDATSGVSTAALVQVGENRRFVVRFQPLKTPGVALVGMASARDQLTRSGSSDVPPRLLDPAQRGYTRQIADLLGATERPCAPSALPEAWCGEVRSDRADVRPLVRSFDPSVVALVTEDRGPLDFGESGAVFMGDGVIDRLRLRSSDYYLVVFSFPEEGPDVARITILRDRRPNLEPLQSILDAAGRAGLSDVQLIRFLGLHIFNEADPSTPFPMR